MKHYSGYDSFCEGTFASPERIRAAAGLYCKKERNFLNRPPAVITAEGDGLPIDIAAVDDCCMVRFDDCCVVNIPWH